MKEIGKMINNMDMVLKLGKMELNLKDIMWKVKNTGLVHFNGQMEVNMKENLLIII